jgi:cytochrome P450
MGLALAIGTLIAAFCFWNVITLVRNYTEARKIGLPILITPVTSMNTIWYLVEGYIVPILRHLPFGFMNFLDYSTTDWPFNDKYLLHAKHGPAFTIVSPGLFLIMLADPPAIQDIYARRNDFVKNKDLYKGLNIFGENVDTVNGAKWQRQRKITAPPFNERNSSLVWRETRSQAQAMLKKWMAYGSDGVPRMDRDTMTLALHVLCGAGFGKFYTFDGQGISSPGKGHDISYKEALETILNNIILAIAFGSMNFTGKYLPPRLKKIQNSMSEFRKYLTEMVEEERRLTTRTTEKDNLMSALVRASDNEARNEKGDNGLTNDELLGNMFIYNLAGHHTTAWTLTYAFALMATNPTWQSWIREEINHVIGNDEESSKYEEAFPQLKRCLAVQVSPVPWI